MAKLLAEENRIMSMNRDEMDEVTLECHTIVRQQILERRNQAMIAAAAGGGAGGGGVA